MILEIFDWVKCRINNVRQFIGICPFGDKYLDKVKQSIRGETCCRKSRSARIAKMRREKTKNKLEATVKLMYFD